MQSSISTFSARAFRSSFSVSPTHLSDVTWYVDPVRYVLECNHCAFKLLMLTSSEELATILGNGCEALWKQLKSDKVKPMYVAAVLRLLQRLASMASVDLLVSRMKCSQLCSCRLDPCTACNSTRTASLISEVASRTLAIRSQRLPRDSRRS